MAVSLYKPIYTTFESVKVRLTGKVAFQDGEPIRNQRQMPDELLGQLIVDAETAVEQDLRGRYAIPFRSKKSGTWEQLPDHTKRAIRTIVDNKACQMILGESFGSGTHINAEGYRKSLTDDYQMLLRRLLGQDLEGQEFGEKRFRRTPPLDDLMLAVTNSADSGFMGAPIDANARSISNMGTDYAAGQVNDPSLSLYWFYGGPRGSR